MFVQQPSHTAAPNALAQQQPQQQHTNGSNMFGPNLGTMSSNQAPVASSIFSPTAPVATASTQNNINRGPLYASEPPSVLSSTAATASQLGTPVSSVEGEFISFAMSVIV